jgi:hypothetical protein
LFDLIGLCFATHRLQIQDFLNIDSTENVVIASDSLFKPNRFKQGAQCLK